MTVGREGRGSVYIWPVGEKVDDYERPQCYYDAYSSSPYTVAVGSITQAGSQESYLSADKAF